MKGGLPQLAVVPLSTGQGPAVGRQAEPGGQEAHLFPMSALAMPPRRSPGRVGEECVYTHHSQWLKGGNNLESISGWMDKQNVVYIMEYML